MADTNTTNAGTATDTTAADKAVADSKVATEQAQSAEGKAAGAGEGTAVAKDDAPAAGAVAYDLRLPEGSPLDPALLERTVAIARERGLSPEQAQAVVDLTASEITARVAAVEQSMSPGGEAWTKQVNAWKAETENDPKLGKTPAERIATLQRGYGVVRKFGEAHPDDAPALNAFLDNSGLGNHPVVARLFAWLAKEAGEGTFTLPDPKDAPPKSTAELLYGPDGGRKKAD